MKASIPAGNIPFKKAINPITGKRSEGKALPAFKVVLRKEIVRALRGRFRAFTSEDVDRILVENLEYYRKKGFDPREVEKFKRLYRELPGRGPRNNSKK